VGVEVEVEVEVEADQVEHTPPTPVARLMTTIPSIHTKMRTSKGARVATNRLTRFERRKLIVLAGWRSAFVILKFFG